jgi:imidazolonepropionase-like amidohydrolase
VSNLGLPEVLVGNLVIRDVTLVDVPGRTTSAHRTIEIVDGRITAITTDTSPIGPGEVDGSGLFASPGLIDCHVHVMLSSGDEHAVSQLSRTYAGLQAGAELERMLRRGFTTVRDVAGADHGLVTALSEGLVVGPRLFHGGAALSPTGGHGDLRPRGDHSTALTGEHAWFLRLVDGADEVRRAARHEIRHGARHLKVMLSGGVASPNDRIDSQQFSDEELVAVVDEASRHGIYCAAHVYTAAGIERGARLGIRSMEHGNLLDEHAAAVMQQHDAFLVPTLSVFDAVQAEGRDNGISEQSMVKLADVARSGAQAIEIAAAAGVRIAFGSDLPGDLRRHQSREFTLRRAAQSSWEVLDSATHVGAALLGHDGELGVLRVGAAADLVLTTANPGEDVTILSDPETYLPVVVVGGRVVVDRRTAA